MMVVQNEYEIGEVVYLKTDREQKLRIILAVKVYKNDLLYELACGTDASMHYPFEMSREINVLMTTTN